MKAYFDRDGRKTNTVNIPQSEDGTCKKNGMDFCTDPKCSGCETKKIGMEYRTVQFLIPIHETTIETGQYAKWSEWDVTPKDRVIPQDGYIVPQNFINGLKTVITMVSDLITEAEQKGGDTQ